MNITVETAYFTPMGRVVDLAQLGGMCTGPGGLTVRVSDPLCPWNEGTWQFETVEGKLQVGRSDKAECELTSQALAALIYGTHDPDDFLIRGWGSVPPAVQAAMRDMFPPMTPYMHEYF
jgi:hypothetical protein